jgi:hypothetical protein
VHSDEDIVDENGEVPTVLACGCSGAYDDGLAPDPVDGALYKKSTLTLTLTPPWQAGIPPLAGWHSDSEVEEEYEIEGNEIQGNEIQGNESEGSDGNESADSDFILDGSGLDSPYPMSVSDSENQEKTWDTKERGLTTPGTIASTKKSLESALKAAGK